MPTPGETGVGGARSRGPRHKIPPMAVQQNESTGGYIVKSKVRRPETNDRDHICSVRCFVGGTDGAGGWRGRGGVAANGRSIATMDFAGKQEVAEETS